MTICPKFLYSGPDVPWMSPQSRIGISFQLQEGFEEFKWFGNGPHESYCDRMAAVRFGCFNSTVNDQYVP